ncbi:MAG TPA: DNA ligase D [Planctomycetaceae bacterium]|nr:DNA ligase D [Planctomycetaceae bacterium]
MALDEYRRKRRFRVTPEPRGKQHSSRKRKGLRFVVQKHAASHLHYDFRLEIDGVLKSWAVPKGPCLDTHERRLAVQVEDHPLEYIDFEGVIPEHEYGGGTVIVWDRGTFTPLGDASEDWKAGKLKIELNGEKLRGGWMLVRMRSRDGQSDRNWLLIKERDDEARRLAEFDVTVEEPQSVKSGRTIEEIADNPKKVWSRSGEIDAPKKSKRPATAKKTIAHKAATKAKSAPAKRKTAALKPADLSGAVREALPAFIEPELATLVDAAPKGNDWLHEIKFDGYRLLPRLARGTAQLFTRSGQDWTAKFAEIAAEIEKLPARQAWLDGEVVALEANGTSSFQALQRALSEKHTGDLVYYAFDLLYLDGYDLRKAPLVERKALLRELLASGADAGRVRYTDHLVGSGPEFYRQSCRMGLEGIVSKRLQQQYRSGRAGEWVKTKCVQREEFVIGGFTDASVRHRPLGALLLGFFDSAGEFRYAGRVGTGFSERILKEIKQRLNERRQTESPFVNLTLREAGHGTHWVRPDLVAQVEFTSWTRDHLLRHPSFQGLREDKEAQTVTHDEPAEISDIEAKPTNGRRKTAAKSESSNGERDTFAGVRLTHPDRVLYSEQGLTKQGLAAYYLQVADWILPHLAGRPLSLVRCPEGQRKACFYQKHAGPGTPDSIHRVKIPGEAQEYLMVDDVAGLVSLVQMGVLEMHPWGARVDDIEAPDRLIFDLDPDVTVEWKRVVEDARRVRDLLAELELQSFVKTTGGKGLHVVVPLQRRQDWPTVKEFARAFVNRLAAGTPDRYTTNLSKAARHGKVFLDYLRNERGSTAVAAYSTRARSHATVSTPLAWDELSAAVQSDHFRVDNLHRRLRALDRDPWEGFFTARQSLTAAICRSVGISKD